MPAPRLVSRGGTLLARRNSLVIKEDCCCGCPVFAETRNLTAPCSGAWQYGYSVQDATREAYTQVSIDSAERVLLSGKPGKSGKPWIVEGYVFFEWYGTNASSARARLIGGAQDCDNYAFVEVRALYTAGTVAAQLVLGEVRSGQEFELAVDPVTPTFQPVVPSSGYNRLTQSSPLWLSLCWDGDHLSATTPTVHSPWASNFVTLGLLGFTSASLVMILKSRNYTPLGWLSGVGVGGDFQDTNRVVFEYFSHRQSFGANQYCDECYDNACEGTVPRSVCLEISGMSGYVYVTPTIRYDSSRLNGTWELQLDGPLYPTQGDGEDSVIGWSLEFEDEYEIDVGVWLTVSKTHYLSLQFFGVSNGRLRALSTFDPGVLGLGVVGRALQHESIVTINTCDDLRESADAVELSPLQSGSTIGIGSATTFFGSCESESEQSSSSQSISTSSQSSQSSISSVSSSSSPSSSFSSLSSQSSASSPSSSVSSVSSSSLSSVSSSSISSQSSSSSSLSSSSQSEVFACCAAVPDELNVNVSTIAEDAGTYGPCCSNLNTSWAVPLISLTASQATYEDTFESFCSGLDLVVRVEIRYVDEVSDCELEVTLTVYDGITEILSISYTRDIPQDTDCSAWADFAVFLAANNGSGSMTCLDPSANCLLTAI